MKTDLYDSGKKIEFISIVLLVRNNGAYLPRLFEMLNNFESEYDVNFSYIFIENGSIDDTHELIKKFLDHRDGSLTILGNNSTLDNLPRTVKMSYLRNYGKNLVPNESQWTLLIDTDIYFDRTILSKLFSHNPTKQNIAMLCAYGLEVIPNSKPNEWVTQHHYYDTFAFVNLENQIFWPNCIFSNCEKCQNTKSTKIIPNGLINVHSAFGGFALIESKWIKDPDVYWYAIQNNQLYLCEHLGFCHNLTMKSQLCISIATDSHVYWDASTFGK